VLVVVLGVGALAFRAVTTMPRPRRRRVPLTY
jgi:hypothetical protein